MTGVLSFLNNCLWWLSWIVSMAMGHQHYVTTYFLNSPGHKLLNTFKSPKLLDKRGLGPFCTTMSPLNIHKMCIFIISTVVTLFFEWAFNGCCFSFSSLRRKFLLQLSLISDLLFSPFCQQILFSPSCRQFYTVLTFLEVNTVSPSWR